MKDVASLSFVIYDDSEIVITAYHQYPQFWNPRPNLENILGIGDNRVYAQPFYVLRHAKYYVGGKKGVCATHNELRN
jgi:hypothetical protein